MNTKTYLIISLVILLTNFHSNAQPQLYNPSFEGQPQEATTPINWLPCSAHSTPDILPNIWGVRLQPVDGQSYVGIITRSDGSKESIGQRFSQTLQVNTCYNLTIYLARSPFYFRFNEPISVRIWIGDQKCKKQQLIYHTTISSNQWRKTEIPFSITTHAPKHYLTLEAYDSDSPPYKNGNILIDNIQALQPCKKASL